MTAPLPDTSPLLLSPLYIWQGGWLTVLSRMENRPHQHVAASLLVGLDGPVRVTVDSRTCQQGAVLVPPEHTQSLASDGPVAVLHLDPDEPAWRSLAVYTQHHPLPEQRLRQALAPLRHATPAPQAVHALLDDMRRYHTPVQLDPRITRACARLRSEGPLELETLARQASLSVSRFRRLFSEQLGVTFKRYLLHLKSQRALALWESGMSLTELAVAAGFYDQPHLNRTLRAMFDALPSRYARGQPVQVVSV